MSKEQSGDSEGGISRRAVLLTAAGAAFLAGCAPGDVWKFLTEEKVYRYTSIKDFVENTNRQTPMEVTAIADNPSKQDISVYLYHPTASHSGSSYDTLFNTTVYTIHDDGNMERENSIQAYLTNKAFDSGSYPAGEYKIHAYLASRKITPEQLVFNPNLVHPLDPKYPDENLHEWILQIDVVTSVSR